MHQGRTRLCDAIHLARLKVDRMTIDRTRADQPVGLIGVQIIPRCGVQRFDPGDLVRLLAQVGLHQAIGVFGPQRPKNGQLIRR